MSQAIQVSAPQAVATEVSVRVASSATKDSGRVHVGGNMMKFRAGTAATKDSGRVHVGGNMMKF